MRLVFGEWNFLLYMGLPNASLPFGFLAKWLIPKSASLKLRSYFDEVAPLVTRMFEGLMF